LPSLALAPAPLPGSRQQGSIAPDDRVWQLLADDTSVTVVSSAATLAEARVCEPDERVVIEFWVDPSGLPGDAIAQLVTQAFARPAVRPRRPVLVCVAKRDGAVLTHAHRHVADAVVRPAGVTCLIEGHVNAVAAESARGCPST
jgi:hypothetical protein